LKNSGPTKFSLGTFTGLSRGARLVAVSGNSTILAAIVILGIRWVGIEVWILCGTLNNASPAGLSVITLTGFTKGTWLVAVSSSYTSLSAIVINDICGWVNTWYRSRNRNRGACG